MMACVRWGLVGASGIAATSIIPAIRAQAGGRVVAVYSTSPERGRAYAHDHGIDRSHDTLTALLDDPEIDAVYVSTTNDRHAAETIAAVTAGRPVLCEKPLALRIEDARAMVAAAARAGVVLATNHPRRNDPAFRAVAEHVRDGRIGSPLAARTADAFQLSAEQLRWRLDPASGGGAALDLLVHEADTLRFVLGEEFTSVQAHAAAPEVDAAEELLAGVLAMTGGLVASFLCAFTTPLGGSTLEVFGERGSVRAWRNPGGPSGLVLRSHAGTEEEAFPWTPPGPATIAAFEAAVRGEAGPTATGEDGVASLAVALAARESARSGARRPVEPVSPSPHRRSARR